MNDMVPAVLASFKVLTMPLVPQATYIHNINPPPESAACSISKPHRWSKPAEPTTLTLALALTLSHSHSHISHPHSHTLSSSALPCHDCHQFQGPLTPHWIALSCVCLHHHSTFRNLTVEGCWMYWHGNSCWCWWRIFQIFHFHCFKLLYHWQFHF